MYMYVILGASLVTRAKKFHNIHCPPPPACMPSTRSQSRSNASKPRNPLPKPIKKPKCTTIIDRGKSRGEPCGRDATYGLYCTRHKKCPRMMEDGGPCRQNRKMYD